MRRLWTDQRIVDYLGLGATLKRVRSWRRRFRIATIIRSLRNDVAPIEGRLQSLLIGSMLGDGRLVRSPNSSHYSENHCLAQLPYLEWKARQWGAWQSPSGIKPVARIIEGKKYAGVRFHTLGHPSLCPWQALFYALPGGKQLRPELIEMVDAQALAIWYMDDGSAGWWPLITFGLSRGSRDVAFEIFKRFGVFPRWYTHKGLTGEFRIVGEEQAKRFIQLIRPHMPECMLYKLEFGFQGRGYQIRQASPEVELRRMAVEGMPIRRMARELGLSASVVSRRLSRLGIEHPRTVGRPLDTFGVEKGLPPQMKGCTS